MKAICVTPSRTLELRDIPAPQNPPPGHILVDMDSATITHGDRFFLSRPLPGGASMSGGAWDVYGSNGAGKVVAIGPGVPPDYVGKPVAIYKTLVRSPAIVGLWCEKAQLPYGSCLILPDHVRVRDYNGSFANVLTVYAFLAQIAADGHKGMIVTAGTSATGRIAVSLARRQNVPAIFVVRSTSARAELVSHGAEHVLVTTEPDFEESVGALSAELGASAVFDGVGGDLLSHILPSLPMNSTIYVYGFLGGSAPVSFSTMLLMGKNLVLRRYSVLENATVSNPLRLAAAMKEIEGLIDEPLFRTRIGKEFSLDQIDQAMAYEETPGARAVFVM
ncbi:zinc-binding dehydrogenase [Labrys monachus]|uniref:NADPH:quinone reductase-like Zn-dependent oxidoreductase n=1 Tax=Labrys monachus TaxID=217067 RepID=A0ABU0FM05_9HYPH|nr:zinc-binding dehydrogenase [Labrys monachus]MDQ0395541.1 NADPH:quinone reductase-like Zn-dependent oxidoreductase [Labrys monachus]